MGLKNAQSGTGTIYDSFNMSKKFTRNLTLIDQALVSGSNFLLVIALTKLLGLENFGTYSVAWLFAHFSMFMSEGFIGEVAMLLVQKLEDDKKNYLKHLFTIVIIYSLIAALVTFSSLALLPAFNLKDYAWAGALFALSFNLHWFARRTFHSLATVKHLLATDTIAYLGRLGFVIIAILMNVDCEINAVFFTFSLLNVLSILPLFLCLGTPRFNEWQKYSKEHIRLSRWLIPSFFMKWFTNHSFILVAELFFGSIFVGVLRNVQNIFSIPSVLSQALVSYLPKHFGDALKVNKKTLFQSVSKITRALFFFSFILGTLISILMYFTGRFYFPNLINHYFSLFLWFSIITTVQISLVPQLVALRTLDDLKSSWQIEAVAFTSMFLVIFPACLILNFNGLMLSLTVSSSSAFIFSLIKKRKHLN